MPGGGGDDGDTAAEHRINLSPADNGAKECGFRLLGETVLRRLHAVDTLEGGWNLPAAFAEVFAPLYTTAMASDEPTVKEQEYEGVYVAHWEVARFVVSKGKWLFGLFQRVEKWDPIFPEGFSFPEIDSAKPMRGPPCYFRMKLRGTLGPRGYFGHLGICRHQLHVTEVISYKRTESPGKTW